MTYQPFADEAFDRQTSPINQVYVLLYYQHVVQMLNMLFYEMKFISNPCSTVSLLKKIKKCAYPDDMERIKSEACSWIQENGSMDNTKCDTNARVCWALLSRDDCYKHWVLMSTPIDVWKRVSDYRQAKEIKQLLFANHDRAIFLLRVMNAEKIDGHSMLTYKCGSMIVSFQAYVNVSPLIYTADEDVIEKTLNAILIENKTTFMPSFFGFDECHDTENNRLDIVMNNRDCFYYQCAL